MASDAKTLTKEWIIFLKNNQIAAQQSDPKTGKLTYKKQPTAADLERFLNLKSDFDEQVIATAIRDALENRPANKSGTAPPPDKTQPTSPQPTQPTTAQPDTENPLAASDEVIDRNNAEWRKNNNIDAMSREWYDSLDSTRPEEPKEPEERKPKLHTKLKTPGTATQKPRVSYRGLKEDISDIAAEEIDEPTVEQIFNSLAFHAPDEDEPEDDNSSATPDPAAQQDEIKQIKRVVRDTMSDAQIKSLWRELTDDANITESMVSRGDVNAIFKKATDLRSKPSGMGRVFKGLRKDTIDITDLQQAWKDEGFPDDTADITHILKAQGFGDKEIKKVFSTVFGDSDDEEGYAEPETSPAVLKIAEYIKRTGITDNIVSFLERDYGQLLGTEDAPGLMSRIKKKFTTEDIRHIFTHIVREERTDRIRLIRVQEQTQLGRKRK